MPINAIVQMVEGDKLDTKIQTLSSSSETTIGTFFQI